MRYACLIRQAARTRRRLAGRVDRPTIRRITSVPLARRQAVGFGHAVGSDPGGVVAAGTRRGLLILEAFKRKVLLERISFGPGKP